MCHSYPYARTLYGTMFTKRIIKEGKFIMNPIECGRSVIRKFSIALSASIVAGLLSGCGFTFSGEPFAEVQFNREKEAVVYFYRPKQFQGYDAVYTVRVDTHAITKELKAGGYTYAVVRPGTVDYSVRSQNGHSSTGTISVNPGSIMYVSVLPSTTYGVLVEQISADEGAEEIANKVLIDGKRLTQ